MTKGSVGSPIGIWTSCLLILGSCSRVCHDIEPQISYSVQDTYLKELPSPFPPLGLTEKETEWGREYRIGTGFAKSLDLYRAITAFRRAEILAPENEMGRKLEIQYEILLCYYLGRRYEDVDEAFSHSGLAKVDGAFPAFHDLLVILYDTYIQLDQMERAGQILQLIGQNYPDTYNNLIVSTALKKADFPLLNQVLATGTERPYLQDFLYQYNRQKKSPTTASMLNAFIPGTGYLYLGQIQTGITALFINGLFIASSVYFFQHGPIAAGIITASFEAGWYIGGIQGGALQGRLYNERLYERTATPMMNREKLFPVFQLNYAF